MTTSTSKSAEGGAPIRIVASSGDVEAPFLEKAESFIRSRTGNEPDWLQRARSKGLEAFRRSGFPHRRVEEWKYTDLRTHISKSDASSSSAGHATQIESSAFDAITLTFVDGAFDRAASSDLTSLSGVEVVMLEDDLGALVERQKHLLCAIDNPVTSLSINGLNLAQARSGAIIRVLPGEALSKPIHIRSVHTGAEISPARHVVVLESGARATLLETNTGDGVKEPALIGQSLQIHLEPNAELSHHRSVGLPDACTLLSGVAAHLEAEAHYAGTTLNLGAALLRQDTHIAFQGEGAIADLTGAYLLNGNQHCDQTIFIDHAVPNCESSQVFKGVLTDRSRGVFQGKVLVAQDAQHTDAHQLSNALLLSERAELDAKPELEIYADDVKCSHGSTAGELDEDALFYLRARGIPLAVAKTLLIEAFVREPIESIKEEAIRNIFMQQVSEWLQNAEVRT